MCVCMRVSSFACACMNLMRDIVCCKVNKAHAGSNKTQTHAQITEANIPAYAQQTFLLNIVTIVSPSLSHTHAALSRIRLPPLIYAQHTCV